MQMMIEGLAPTRPWAVLAGAMAIDVFFGEYPSALHPVVAMGTCIGALVKRARGSAHPRWQLLYGAATALGVPAMCAGLTAALLGLAGRGALGAVGPWLVFALEVY